MAKRNYWLKLKEDYFQSPKIKKLRSVAGGDTYALIYLEMQCYSIRNKGIIKFEGLEDNLAKELALILNEKEENVAVLLSFLERYKLIELVDENKYLLPEAMLAIGSESESAERVRRYRSKQKALQCNEVVTEKKQSVTKRNTDIDIDLYIDIEKIKEYIYKNSLAYVNADEFFNYYSARDWRTNNGSKITNWQALLQNWNTRAKHTHDEQVRQQIKLAEKHHYQHDGKGKVEPIPINAEIASTDSFSSFQNLLQSNGKSSKVIENLVRKIAEEKDLNRKDGD